MFKRGQKMSSYLSAVIEILHLANGIISMINSGAANGGYDGAIDKHFKAIGKIAAENAAKPEIQGYSEHE